MTDLSPEARELFRTALEGARPSPADRARVQAAVFAQVGVTAPVASATAKIAASGIAAKLKVLAVIAAVVGGGAVGARVVVARRAASEHRASRTVSPISVQPSVVVTPSPVEPAVVAPPPTPEVAVATPSVEPVLIEPAIAPHPSHHHHASTASSSGDTSQDLELLTNARQALAQHRSGDALHLLDQHARSYPSSPFREERAYTRIRALCDVGRASDARTAAQQFTRNWPSSTYTSGIRRSCAGGNNTPPDRASH